MNYLLQFQRSMSSNKTAFLGALVVSVLVGVGTVHAETAPDKPASKAKAASKTPPRRPLYSSERSLTRQAKLARARAAAMAREIATTQLPRYKMDASGDLVPDVRAAAAIIYDPETGKILWEENSQDQRSIAQVLEHHLARHGAIGTALRMRKARAGRRQRLEAETLEITRGAHVPRRNRHFPRRVEGFHRLPHFVDAVGEEIADQQVGDGPPQVGMAAHGARGGTGRSG